MKKNDGAERQRYVTLYKIAFRCRSIVATSIVRDDGAYVDSEPIFRGEW